MDVVTNSALYLFSALLQADAALLGFGAVFVVYKLQDIDNDLLFYFVQRKCYNDITRMTIVRTAGFQLATERGLLLLDKYQENSDNVIRTVNENDNIPEFLKGSEVTEEK